MNPDHQQRIRKIKFTVAGYNAIANLVWSVLNLAPVFVFCYRLLPLTWLWIFLGLSLLTGFLPKPFFSTIQLGETRNLYQKLGVGFVNKFTQNGEIINKLIRRKFPDYKVVSTDKHSVKKALRQTFMFEKFHFVLFVFFSFILFYALVKGYFAWATVLFITNLLYNIYPCLLQQYTRIRLLVALKKHNIT